MTYLWSHLNSAQAGLKKFANCFVHPYAKQFCTKQNGNLESFPTFHLSRCRSEQKLPSAVCPDSFAAAAPGGLSVRTFSWTEAFRRLVNAELNLYMNVQIFFLFKHFCHYSYLDEPRYSDYASGWAIRASIPARGKRFFCLLQKIEDGSGAHPASRSLGIGGCFSKSKVTMRRCWLHSLCQS
jgi:hypothetical protein